MYRCPVCGEMLSVEMLPVGKNAKGKRVPKFFEALEQTARWSVETALRVYLTDSARNLYFTCNNKVCPAHWKLSKQIYFIATPIGTVTMQDDLLGLRLTLMKSQFKKKQNKNK